MTDLRQHDVTSDVLDVRSDAGTLVVTLSRPAHANALDPALMDELSRLWAAVAQDPAVRCVVLTGGGRHFCAGADMSMLAAERTDVGETAAEELAFLPGDRIEVPVVVAVNGPCAGGGLHFVADADIVIAAESASFVDPHVSVGQVSGIEPVELIGTVRPDRVARMALLGRHEVLGAAAALDAGLVSEVVPDTELLDRALQLAEQIGTGSPAALRHTRRIVRAVVRQSHQPYRDLGWELVRRHWSHPDSTEGPLAFQEKRRPRWTSR